MLLNPSHEITNAGLPPDVQVRYVRYKQGSRAIVSWMTRYGPEKFKGRKTLPIKQMVALGRLLCNKKDEIGTLPPDVDYYFQEVIKDRAYLSEHFRKHRDQCAEDDIDTINHEHFTESMKQIHAILLTAGKPCAKEVAKHNVSQVRRSRLSASSTSGVHNSFSHLLPEEDKVEQLSDESNEEVWSDADTDVTSECSHSPIPSNTCACEEDGKSSDFLDTEGEVGVAVESVVFLDTIKFIAGAVKSCWINAGKGDASLPASAAYTNILLVKAASHVRDFFQSEAIPPDFHGLKQRLQYLSYECCDTIGKDLESYLELLEALDEAESQLKTLLKTGDHNNRPAAYVQSSGRVSEASLISTFVADLQSVLQDRAVSALTFDGLVNANELGLLFNRDDDQTTLLSSAAALYLISVGHCAYSSVLKKPSLAALPRISALKMANEALSTIRSFIDDKDIFPCQCVNTLGYRVAQMKAELEAFSKYKCWNILMQSPLIAGNHILEILDLCSFYGMHLLHYRQYVAAVLHSYQALVQVKHLNSITIVEEACDMFAPVLYSTGSRPESGFMASWLRYTGARIKFRKGRKHQNHKDTWCMSVPAHAAARSAGLNIGSKADEAKSQPKFDFGTIDRIARTKHDGWNLSADDGDALYRELRHVTIPSEQVTSFQPASTDVAPHPAQKTRHSRHKRNKGCYISKASSSTVDHDCLSLSHALNASFLVDGCQGRNLPSSRINLLCLFHSMTKVVAGVSDAIHAEDHTHYSSASSNSGRRMCICFVQTILRGADRIQDARKRSSLDANGAVWTKNEKECIECYKTHLMKMLEDTMVLNRGGGSWLWSSI